MKKQKKAESAWGNSDPGGKAMNQQIKAEIAASVKTLRLPSYQEIPAVGLFLDQTAKYISEYLAPLHGVELTTSMISNYVKKGLIDRPVRKQYSREQIAYLMFIAVAKSVITLEEVQQLIDLQKLTYSPERAYTYFCQELENVLFTVYGLKEQLETVSPDDPTEKTLLRSTIIAVAHKTYLSKCFAVLRQEQ